MEMFIYLVTALKNQNYIHEKNLEQNEVRE